MPLRPTPAPSPGASGVGPEPAAAPPPAAGPGGASTTPARVAFNLPVMGEGIASRAPPFVDRDGVSHNQYHIGIGANGEQALASLEAAELTSEDASRADSELSHGGVVKYGSPVLKKMGVYDLVTSQLPPLSLDTAPAASAAPKRARDPLSDDGSPPRRRPRAGSPAASDDAGGGASRPHSPKGKEPAAREPQETSDPPTSPGLYRDPGAPRPMDAGTPTPPGWAGTAASPRGVMFAVAAQREDGGAKRSSIASEVIRGLSDVDLTTLSSTIDVLRAIYGKDLDVESHRYHYSVLKSLAIFTDIGSSASEVAEAVGRAIEERRASGGSPMTDGELHSHLRERFPADSNKMAISNQISYALCKGEIVSDDRSRSSIGRSSKFKYDPVTPAIIAEANRFYSRPENKGRSRLEVSKEFVQNEGYNISPLTLSHKISYRG